MNFRRLVLRETSGEMDVRLIATINEWQFIAEIPFSGNTPHQIQWMLNDETAIVFLEDFLLSMNYLVIQGLLFDTVKQQVENGLEIFSEQDLFDTQFDGITVQIAIQRINAIALTAPTTFDVSYFTKIKQALNSQKIPVQKAAIFAVNYLPWIEFREELLKLETKTPELSIDIETIVAAIDSNGWVSQN